MYRVALWMTDFRILPGKCREFQASCKKKNIA